MRGWRCSSEQPAFQCTWNGGHLDRQYIHKMTPRYTPFAKRKRIWKKSDKICMFHPNVGYYDVLITYRHAYNVWILIDCLHSLYSLILVQCMIQLYLCISLHFTACTTVSLFTPTKQNKIILPTLLFQKKKKHGDKVDKP